MTIAKALQWPFTFVWPLLFSRRIVRAKEFAQEVAGAGELRKMEFYQHVGFATLLVHSKADREWSVNIRPVHFGGWYTEVIELKYIKYIEFEYCPKGVTERHRGDLSTYLKIKNMR